MINTITLSKTQVDFFKILTQKIIRKFNSFTCVIMNGGHELYVTRRDGNIFQQCIFCQHETHGWKIGKNAK